MNILGINAFHGDSSAALLKDGQLTAAIEEERFNRIKHWAGFPAEAANWCLEQTDPADLAQKVLYLRDHPEVTERYGKNARRLAEQEFSRDDLAERALGVLERVAQRS